METTNENYAFEQEKKNQRMKQKRDSFSYMYIARKIKKDNRALSRYIIEKEKIHSPFVVVVLRY
jgi:ribosomal protein S18